ncbi:TetR/AcrR family transcriptional regulator [Actinobacteria bacterium YIM 96077]|uniref:TetR family transcriptional regulator n=1 Tax=Phytoactinopolyspora halophila TaxID=1981511 RepID=A0A329QA32_9ACTN|nr:TetR/AcrR family transcriptional regulator [Phytoactinopolyspora halophila]AYY13058.1 TetR/AcrR family transcriptional regulator [Actinobacteria bacterium YIM 96077]RAW09255.1 TetR family transcriptional regulator [Phytoactinopolyspora halophila]
MKDRGDTRQRIIRAATELLERDGREGVTTRAVCATAGVQPPTLYRQFADMNELLDEVADIGFSQYLERKHAIELTDDPVADLRRGWDTHVEFGLENPAYYLLMYSRPTLQRRSRTDERALDRLRMLVERIAVSGRLTVPVDTAVDMVHSAGVGLTLNLLQTPREHRDLTLPRRLGDAVIDSITAVETSAPADLAQRAISLRAVLDQAPDLYSPGERALLDELLARAASRVT